MGYKEAVNSLLNDVEKLADENESLRSRCKMLEKALATDAELMDGAAADCERWDEDLRSLVVKLHGGELHPMTLTPKALRVKAGEVRVLLKSVRQSCKCGHGFNAHHSFEDHDECDECEDDDPCTKYQQNKEAEKPCSRCGGSGYEACKNQCHVGGVVHLCPSCGLRKAR